MRFAGLIIAELNTPTGQIGPLDGAYRRAAGGVWHAVVGAVFCAVFGLWGLPSALVIATIYWAVKEIVDLRRGGGLWDSVEDAICVCLGAWYGVWWWPAMVCLAGGIILASAAVRTK
jgi:hypothetical protein